VRWLGSHPDHLPNSCCYAHSYTVHVHTPDVVFYVISLCVHMNMHRDQVMTFAS
jgi:hypothetical protein